MMWPDQWWIGAALLVGAIAVFVWGIRIHDESIGAAARKWFNNHVAWRLRRSPPTPALASPRTDARPVQTIEMPFVVNNSATVPNPLLQQERGPCLEALIQIRKFVFDEVGQFHAKLVEARNSENMDGLLPKAHTFRQTAEKLKFQAEFLQAQHRPWLRRMDAPELTALAKKLDELKKQLIGVKEGRTWQLPALLERVKPMHNTNLEVGKMAADLVRAYDDKQAEFFSDLAR